MQKLPNPEDLYCVENIEHALLCVDEERWNIIQREAIINGTLKPELGVSSSESLFDDLEQAFENGEDFHAIIQQSKYAD